MLLTYKTKINHPPEILSQDIIVQFQETRVDELLSIARRCGDIVAVSNTLTLVHTLTSHVTLVKITAISELPGCDLSIANCVY